MLIVREKISIDEVRRIARETFGTVVKVVVDVERRIMAIGGELHSDEEAELLRSGSKQENLWGINIYPDAEVNDFIEFDSLINLRPSQGNRTRGIDDPELQKKILDVVNSLIIR